MRTKVVILLPPRFNLFFGVFERQEPVSVETLIPKRAVKRLDEWVVGRTARTREVERDPLLVRPPVKGTASKLTTVIRLNPFRRTVVGDKLLQDRYNLLARDVLVSMYGRTFSRVLIDDRERPKAPAVEECI